MRGLTVGRAHKGPIIRQSAAGSSSVVPLGPNAEAALVLEQLTDFDEFFSILYPRLRSYYWFLDGARFAVPESSDHWFDSKEDRYRSPTLDAFSSGVIATHQSAMLVRPGFLEEFAKYLVDDWCDILGLVATPEEPQAFFRRYAGVPKRGILPGLRPRADVAFFCIDGIRWELFARDADVLSLPREQVSSRNDLRVQELTWEESSG